MNKDKKERLLKDCNVAAVEALMRKVMEHILPAEVVSSDGLADTPLRVAAMYGELLSGYGQDGQQVLKDAMFADVNCKDMVLVKGITFSSLCEHHMLPFMGKVSIAYIPQDGNIVGLSKLGRLVDVYAKRVQVQERLGQQIADDIEAVMNPKALAVIIEAEHTCMTIRGISKPGAKTVTSCVRGAFYTDDKARAELIALLK